MRIRIDIYIDYFTFWFRRLPETMLTENIFIITVILMPMAISWTEKCKYYFRKFYIIIALKV